MEIDLEQVKEIQDQIQTARETRKARELEQALEAIEESIVKLIGMPLDKDMCPACGEEIPSGCSYACERCWQEANDDERDIYRRRQSM